MITATVVIPTRNEEMHIERCLESIFATTFNKNQLEIIVIDGISEDNTRTILNSLNWQGISHTILENPNQKVSFALNLGIRHSQGEYIIRMDAHTTYHKDYISNCVHLLEQKKAVNVGGPMIVKSKTPLDHAIALATSSRFGIGNSHFHFPNYEGYVDTVYLGAFKKNIFDKIGLFDESLTRNQDDELNFRIISNGEKIYMTPQIKSFYHPRSSILKLVSQYGQYGFWKVRVMQKHKTVVSIRHLIPMIFVLGLVSLISFSHIFIIKTLLLFVCILYSICVLIVIGLHLKSKPTQSLFYLPVIFPALHFSYGIGFILGIIKFILFPKPSINQVIKTQ